MIYFKYDERKAAQAAGILLKKAGGRMDYYLLTKILYLAERNSLKKWNRMMLGGNLSSMEFGPAHSSVLDSVNQNDSTSQYWINNISKPKKNKISLLNSKIEDEELSDREINLLNDLFEEFKDYTFEQIKAYTHDLPEYEETTSSIPIEVSTILKNFNRNEETLQSVEATANLRNRLSAISY